MTEYNMIYGYMTKAEVASLTEAEKSVMIMEWLSKKPTPTNRKVVDKMIQHLGEGFLDYITGCAVEAVQMNGDLITPDNVVIEIQGILDMFYTDLNIFFEVVRCYKEQ